MIDLVLDDLRGPPGKLPALPLPVAVQVLHLDVPIAQRLADSVEGEAALLGLVGAVFFQDHGIVHHHIDRAHVHNDVPLFLPYHVCGHADAAITIGKKCVGQILADRKILAGGRFRLLTKKKNVSDDRLDHSFLFYCLLNDK